MKEFPKPERDVRIPAASERIIPAPNTTHLEERP